MNKRDSILKANRVASQLLEDTGARERIKDGYTRIDPLAVAESCEVAVCFQKLQKLLGAFLENPEPGIIVNRDRPAGLVHMTTAHELGHFAMKHGPKADHVVDQFDADDPQEVEADAFAAALLTPRWLVAPTIRERRIQPAQLRDPLVAYQLSLRLGLSYTALLSTLVRMKIMSWTDTKPLRNRQPNKVKVASLVNDQQLDEHADIWVLTPADKDHILEPRASDRFVLDVPNHLSAGYLWTLDEALSEGFTLVPQKAPKPSKIHPGDAVGSTDAHAQYALEHLDGTQVDAVDLVFVEKQPWREQIPDDVEFQLRTEFGDFADGFTEGARRRRIEASRAD